MHKKIINYIKNEAIFKGSIILLISTGILYVCSYLYHFYTGRVLGPEQYSIIGTLFSLLYIILVPSNTIQMSITKFVSEFKTKKEYGKIKYLLVKSLKKLFFYGVLSSIIFIAISPFLAKFLKVPLIPVIILGISIVFSLLIPSARGVLQGLQSFKSLGINLSIEGFGKIGFVILLVSLGFGINGAIFALVLSSLVAFLIILKQLKPIFAYEVEPFETKQVYNYSWPVLMTFLSLTLMYSIDLLLVKHFFSNIDAGHYAALSLIGKILFFATFPIIQVMFPLASELKAEKSEKKHLLHLLYKSLGIISLISFGIITLYFLFSRLMVTILFGNDYLNISPLIGFFGIFMLIYSLIYLFSFYNLSINKTKFVPILILSNIIEAIFIWFYHPSILQVVYSLIILSFITLIFIIMYTKYSK
ncbi:MAG: oligosaccharide flippase family protein [Candidatus Nanoarchaeia archaeon]